MGWLVITLLDNFNIAFKNIKERKSRVFLTLLGIAIGIMAIVSLMGIGDGMQEAVAGELSSLTDTVIVTAGGEITSSPMGGGFSGSPSTEYFTERDVDDVERISGLKSVDPVLFSMGAVEYNGEVSYSATILGLDPDRISGIFGIGFLGLEEGSFIEEGDQYKCVIGWSVAHEHFDSDVHVGSRLLINGKKFFVNGIYKEQGSGMSVPTDDYVHIADYDLKRMTGDENVSGIIVRVADVGNVEGIADEIEFAINENHGGDDFADATTMNSIIDSIQQVLGIISVVLLGIAAIALVVASIGIMNTMLTSVMERTHEIGVMKAIGARNSDVSVIFIMEGVMISVIGGAVGIFLGFLGMRGFSMASSSGFMGGFIPLEPVLSLYSVVLSISVAVVVGVVSSLYPARKAAKMSPIEAVRYE